jgi:hypothetical protein
MNGEIEELRDLINNPKHYTQGIECADYIESHGMDFFQGNAVKYLTRFRHKGTPIEDLKKARWYIDRLITQAEKNSVLTKHQEKT